MKTTQGREVNVDMSEYEDTPHVRLPRGNGEYLAMYRRKDDPTVYLPVVENDEVTEAESTVFDFTAHLQEQMSAGNITK